MSIMLSNYIESNHLSPVVPSWFRTERYDYCEPIRKSTASSKRNRFSAIADKKQGKK